MSQSGVTSVNEHYDWMGVIIMDKLAIFDWLPVYKFWSQKYHLKHITNTSRPEHYVQMTNTIKCYMKNIDMYSPAYKERKKYILLS